MVDTLVLTFLSGGMVMRRICSQGWLTRGISSICIFLAACSSTHTQTVSPAQQNQLPQAATTAATPLSAAGLHSKTVRTESVQPIFVPFREQFKQSDGTLAPYLQEWAEQLSQERQIPLSTITELLLEVDYEPTVIRLMTPAQSRQRKRSWPVYRNRTLDAARINAGLEFWRRHDAVIRQTAQTYEVPASILVAIIGVETIYGQYMGDFKVLRALANLGFSYPDPDRPERAAMFRAQLADFIELHHQNKVDAQRAVGSYAGAMGLPQFMPTSIKNWAIDAEQKGHVDLYHSIPDTLSSIANFLNHHGWQAGLPIFMDITLDSKQAAHLVAGGLEPTLNAQTLAEHDIRIDPVFDEALMFGVIDLVDEPNKTAEYRLATPNFFALTAYNRSYFYASSVTDFACALERRYYERLACNLWQPPKS